MYPQFTQSLSTQQQNPWLQQMLGQSISQSQQNVIRVNGRPGAEALNLPPNSDALLLDNTAPIVWLAQTDGAGYKALTPYDISPHQEEKKEDELKKLEARVEALEGKFNAKQSNSTDVKSRKSERNATSICSDDER